MMIVILPASLMAQDATRGLLHNDGGTWLNESPAPPTAAIFPDSLVQTDKNHRARIEVEGSSVLIQPDTMVQFQGHELALDHGTVQLDTAREMEVLIGCITVSPITSDRTQYDVSDVDGKVKVVAAKNDVKIHSHLGALQKSRRGASSDVIVRQGEQAIRDEHCGPRANRSQAISATGSLLNSPIAITTATAVVGVLVCLGLCHTDDPVSPDKP
jgi:hypothetical protein